jgi:hypothetical protein
MKRFADPHLDWHLAVISERFTEEYVQTYRLRWEGARLKDIAIRYGISEQGVVFRLRRISVFLGQVAGGEVQANMSDSEDFTTCARVANELINRATRDHLADVARLLALNIGHYHDEVRGMCHRRG